MDNKNTENDLDASKTTPNVARSEPTATTSQGASRDIQSILASTKLPERREVFVSEKKAPTPVPPTAPAPAQPTTPAAPRESLVSVHTLKDDLQAMVKEKKMSLVRAAALEEDKRAHHNHEPEFAGKPRNKKGIVFLVAFIVALGILAIFSVTVLMNERATSNAALTGTTGMMFSEQTVPLAVENRSASNLRRAIAESRGASLTLGAILRVVPTVTESADNQTRTRELSGSEFFRTFGIAIPDTLERALADEYFIGVHTVDENAPLFIFSIQSYERAFAGMLAWEPTMNADLTPIFSGVPSLTRNSDGALVNRSFEDVVIRNYDVRALKDDAGAIQLYYTFPTRDLLIIAESPFSFNEILSRLRAERRI